MIRFKDPATAPDDESVRSKVLEGEKDWFEIIVRRYNQQLYRVGMSYLRDHQRVEDAMQTTYLKVYENLDSYRSESTFSTWITRIMINECLMIIRKEKREPKITADLPLPGNYFTVNDHGENRLTFKEMKTMFEKAILQLPDKYRTVYMLRMVQEMDTKETAECMDMSRDNVRVYLHRSKNMIRDKLIAMSRDTSLFRFDGELCDRLSRIVMEKIRKI